MHMHEYSGKHFVGGLTHLSACICEQLPYKTTAIYLCTYVYKLDIILSVGLMLGICLVAMVMDQDMGGRMIQYRQGSSCVIWN